MRSYERLRETVNGLVCQYKSVSVMVLLVTLPLCSGAQELLVDKHRWLVKGELVTQTTGAFSESLRLPGLRRQLSEGRGFRLGLEYVWKAGSKGQLFQDLNWTDYWHRAQERGFSLTTSLGYRRSIGRGYVEATAGGGYWHSAFAEARVLQDHNGGFYTEKHTATSPVFSSGLGAGYRISQDWDAYLKHIHYAQLPAETQSIRLHRTLNLGVRVKLRG